MATSRSSRAIPADDSTTTRRRGRITRTAQTVEPEPAKGNKKVSIFALAETDRLTRKSRDGMDLSDYTDIVQRSWENRNGEQGEEIGITFPSEGENAASVHANRLRRAAENLSLGLSVAMFPGPYYHPVTESLVAEPGETRLVFAAKPKTERRRLTDEERAQREAEKEARQAERLSSGGRKRGRPAKTH